MDQIRMLIAIALSFLVFFVWQYFFTDRKEPQQNIAQQESVRDRQRPEITKEMPAIKSLASDKTSSQAKQKARPVAPEKMARMIIVDAPFYKVAISEKGAVFKSYVLKDYREKVGAHQV